MKTQTLFRPVGLKELMLILEAQAKAFPPRLPFQPIFYPVLNKDYACQIANDWNTLDENSSYAGFVTEFDVISEYLEQFEVQNVGGSKHDELWIPAEDLLLFNQHIVGDIRVVAAFYGESYTGKHIDFDALNTLNTRTQTNHLMELFLY